jgi:broad specificity phosphatase PhoE
MIYLLRHFETNENSLGLIMGQLEADILSGNADILLPKEVLYAKKIDIYSSTSLRCRRTVENLCNRRNITKEINVHYNETLLERQMGVWEGMKKSEIMIKHRDMFDGKNMIPFMHQEGGEEYGKFRERVDSVYKSIKIISYENVVIVCSHNQVLKMMWHLFREDNNLSYWNKISHPYGRCVEIDSFSISD